MSQEIQKKRTWAAYACPMCRFVFRISKQHEGSGVVCPACQHLLKIPSDGESLGEDKDTAVSKVQHLIAAEDGSGALHERSASGRSKKREFPVFWTVSALLAMALLFIMVKVFVTEPEREEITLESRLSRSVVFDEDDELLGKPLDAPTAESLASDAEIRETLDTGNQALELAEGLLSKFFAVKNVEDFESLVRRPEVTMPRIRQWYESRPLKFAEINKIAYRGDVRVKGKMVSVLIQMADYTVKAVALEKTKDGYRVDWESWVTWTEMDWDSLFKERPTTPKTMLVQCSVDTYYNREFNDESKWVALKMTNPQSYKTLYGYIDRSDPALMRFTIGMGGQEARAILKVRYPENSEASNQVLITEVVSVGWVFDPAFNPKADKE